MPGQFPRLTHVLHRLLIISLITTILIACGGGDKDPTGRSPATTQPQDTPPPPEPTTPPDAPPPSGDTPPPEDTPPPSTGEAEWLIMLYADADDNILERDILMDLNEAEKVGSTDQVHIVAQVDRFVGAFGGMGDWTGTKRFYLTQDDDLKEINSQELADLGELNMAAGETLADFIIWAVENYPARKHALIMSDHGSGWPGGYSDPDPGGRGDHDVFLADYMDDNLWLLEIDAALESARAQVGLDKFELIGFDACLMSQFEVYAALTPHARYAVASEEVEPGLGWAYTAFLGQLVADPAMDGAALAQAIVNSYIDQDQRLVDDETRKEFLAEHNVTEDVPPDLIAEELFFDATLSGVDLQAIPALGAALDNLVLRLADVDQQTVAEARAFAQSFENVFGSDIPSPYIDLGHFVLWLRENGGADVAAAADQLLNALDQAVIAERHGPGRPGATGMALHFPTHELYEIGDNLGYTTVADRSARDYQWDEFLHVHFTGERKGAFGEASAAAKPIQIAPLTLSSEIATPDQPVNMQTEIAGDRLGFIYSFIGRVLPDEELLIVEDIDYLFSDETQVIGGVPYPVWWPEGVLIDFDWDASIYAINDGVNSVRALAAPDTYGDTPTYATEGRYVFADGSEPVYAKLFFREGELTQVYGYVGSGDTGAPREITPQYGDQFVVWEQGIDLRDEATEDDITRDGGVLTFGDELFWIETIPAPSGSYIVGFMAEDLDGEIYSEFQALFVESAGASSVEGFVPYASEELGFAVLYPETWEIEEEIEEDTVTFYGDYGITLAMVVRDSYPDATSADEANDLGIQDVLASFEGVGDLQDVQFVTEVEDFILGGFDAKTIDFTFLLEGEFFYGSVIVTTPVLGTTYAFLILSLDADYESALDHFNPMLQSFDILISGVSKEQAGPPPPDFEEVGFYDDYSDATSGLEQVEEEWGLSYYADYEEYVMELVPYGGPIYDYYLDWTLSEVFMIEVLAGYGGAANNGYGVIFQFVGDGQFYVFRISGDGFYTIERGDGDDLTTLVEWTPSDLIDQTELNWNVLTVEGWGDTYYVYINGHMVDSFTDATYSGGTFGIIVDNFDEEAPAVFYFDDYAVGTPMSE
jgi:hypothetical protein